MRARVIKSTGNLYTTLTSEKEQLICRLPGRFRQRKSGLTNPVAVGDWVEIEKIGEDWSITELIPRENYLIRKASRLDKQFQIVASNLDLAIIIASVKSPRTSTGFIDRFLASCSSFGIESAIIFNKIDLFDESDLDSLESTISAYKNMGITVLSTSFSTGEISDTLRALIRSKTVVLFGHSGVGKSTLINELIGDDMQKVAPISEHHQKGVHTTTFAECFVLKGITYVIDTPGVREFGLAEIEPWQLSHYCSDFQPFIQECTFNNCLHLHEPKCGVQKAVAEGGIAEFRYLNYLSMMESEFGMF